MPSYIGFSTINTNVPRSTNLPTGTSGGVGSTTQPVQLGNKFRLVDVPLVLRDFVNSLNIRQGEKVGKPEYGTTLWSFIFEPNTADVQFQIENEIRRIANLDPRLILNSIRAYPQELGILLEVEMAVAPFNQALLLNVFFNSSTNIAVLQ
jgi:phage baseplate assembly protein W